MPTCSFFIASIACERRQNKRTRQWFKVWTIERVPDDSLPVQESLAGYETANRWIASLCDRALAKGVPVRISWKDGPWLRQIVEIELVEKVA